MVRLLAGRFFTTLSAISIVAVAVAVAVQILVLSVMNGFRTDLISKFIGLNPHLRVTSEEALPALGITLLPSVEGEGILTAAGDIETGIKIRGVTPDTLAHMTSLTWAMPEGESPISLLNDTSTPPLVMIGSELAGQIGATPDGGRTVTLIAPFGQLTPSGDLAPNRMTVKIGGVFKSGLYEVDQSLVLMSKTAAHQLLGPQARNSNWGYLSNPMQAEEVAHHIRDANPTLKVSTWQEENAALFGALKLERIVMTILLVLVVAIAATGIVGVLVMTGLSRKSEVGILLALGATARQVRQIFVLHGAMIGIIGGALGSLLAIAGCMWISRGGIPLPESLYLHTLPVSLSVSGLALIGVAACALTTVAAWYPTRDLNEVQVMRWLKGE